MEKLKLLREITEDLVNFIQELPPDVNRFNSLSRLQECVLWTEKCIMNEVESQKAKREGANGPHT